MNFYNDDVELVQVLIVLAVLGAETFLLDTPNGPVEVTTDCIHAYLNGEHTREELLQCYTCP